MVTSVKRYEHIQDASIDAWSYTWPAVSGCGTRQLYYNATSAQGPSDTTVLYYEPMREVNVKDNRKLRGYHPKLAYPYSHTPRFVSRRIYRQFVLKRLDGANGYRPIRQFGQVERVGGYCTPVVHSVQDMGPQYPMWWENSVNFVGTDNVLYDFDSAEIDAAITDVENNVAIEALTSYDLLTELAEMREIPKLVTSACESMYNILTNLKKSFKIKDLKRAGILRPIDLLTHPERVFRNIANMWMGYRYGVMPLVYSMRDILKTIDRGVNMVNRKARYITPRRTSTQQPSPAYDYKWSAYEGQIIIRGNIFQHFDFDTVANFSGIGFNPAVTAWELIPYSFVFDWFVNMGDYITRSTAIPMNDGYSGCMSKRSKYTRTTWVHFKADDKYISASNYIPTNWWGSTPDQLPQIKIARPEESQPLYRDEVDEYERWMLFSLNGARLQFNPSLNWKRLLDGSVLSYNLLRNLVNKSLK